LRWSKRVKKDKREKNVKEKEKVWGKKGIFGA
jgi:hypothetical protein